jgi:PIN domain nuclease of toxin-antitoxin system
MRTFVNRLIAAGALSGLALAAAPAEALVISGSPSETTVATGDAVSLTLTASQLNALVAGFDIDVAYNAGVLSFDTATFGLALGDPAAFEALTVTNPSPGVVEVAEVSLLSAGDLAALQTGPTFELAQLDFTATGPGAANFSLPSISAVDPNGTPIPEPATLSLFAGGLPILLRLRRRANG